MYKVLGHSACVYCKQAIQLLASNGKSFTYLDVRTPEHAGILQELRAAGITQVPQIYQDDEHIGGYTELQQTLQGT